MQLSEVKIGMNLEAQGVHGVWAPAVVTNITHNAIKGDMPIVEVRLEDGGVGFRTLDELRRVGDC